MRSILLSALALGAMTTVALAAPAPLTDVQMDKVTAGVSPWLKTTNPGGQPNGCGGGNPNCQTIKDNPSAKN